MIAALDLDKKIFVIDIVSLNLGQITIYPAWEAEITLLVGEGVTVLVKYLDYANVFSKKTAVKLPKRLDINEHAINLKPGKQLSYEPIYNLGLMELETLTLISRPTWSITSSALLNLHPGYSFHLSGNLTVASASVLIIRISTIWKSRLGALFH